MHTRIRHVCANGLLALCGLMSAGAVHSAVLNFGAPLGPEVTGATGSGSVQVAYDDATFQLTINAIWTGLSGTTTVAHIHCCTAAAGTGTAGVAVVTPTLTGFPTGVTFGSYSRAFDLNDPLSFNPTFVTNNGGTVAGARATLLAALNAGRSYLNIHSSTFGGGEIRGFLRPVPEPGSLALLALGLLGLGLSRRRPVRA